jgi:hypothetical protein
MSTNLDINLVTTEDNRNVFTNTDKITMPVGDVLVSNSRGNIKHNDSTLTLNTIVIKMMSHQILSLYIPVLILTSNHHGDHRIFLDQQYPKC